MVQEMSERNSDITALLLDYDCNPVTVRSRGRTITDSDFSQMTNLTWTTSELHTNEDVMREREFGTRILAGGCVVAFALGLATPAVTPELTKRSIRLVAIVGYDEIRFHSPLRPETTIYVESTLASLRRTSRPERAVITFHERVVDHGGTLMIDYRRSALCEGSFADLENRK